MENLYFEVVLRLDPALALRQLWRCYLTSCLRLWVWECLDSWQRRLHKGVVAKCKFDNSKKKKKKRNLACEIINDLKLNCFNYIWPRFDWSQIYVKLSNNQFLRLVVTFFFRVFAMSHSICILSLWLTTYFQRELKCLCLVQDLFWLND